MYFRILSIFDFFTTAIPPLGAVHVTINLGVGFVTNMDSTQCPQHSSVRYPHWNPKVDQNGHTSLNDTVYKYTVTDVV